MTAKAVNSFLRGSGALLYFWGQDEASTLVRSVYDPEGESKPVYATEVFAMSAVGSYCDAEGRGLLVREGFLHLFLYMLISPPDMCNLRRMRLFACLAICRFTNNVESARILMCKRYIPLKLIFNALTARSICAEYWEGDVYVFRF
jgi:hypothetical protein